jgi:hypothetical protein
MFAKAIERIVASKGAYLPKIHKDTVLSMSISDEDTILMLTLRKTV